MARGMLRIVLASAVLLAAAGLGTWASYSDTASSVGNQFVAGSLDLLIKNNDSSWMQTIPEIKPTWVMKNMAPGDLMDYDYSQTRQIDLRVAGSVPAATIKIGVSNTVVDPPGPSSDTEEGTTDMDTMMEIVWAEYENSERYVLVDPAAPLAGMIADVNGNGYPDLDDLENGPVAGLNAPSGTGRFQMQVRFHPDADSDYQGDSVVSAFTFTVSQ